MNYFRLHIGDYIRDASHLSLLEHGVYLRLLQVYYTREKPIPHDERHRLVGARSREERAAVDAVLKEFFGLVDDLWMQARCDREIAEAREAGEDNAARRDNERERQRRHRERRKELFAQLRDRGVVPAYDTPTEKLIEMLASREPVTPVTRDGHNGPRLSNSQEPITNTKEEEHAIAAGFRHGRQLGHVPKDWAEWASWWQLERGVETSVRDRVAFVPLATRWVKAGVTVVQMREALLEAEATATKPIAYLPAYVDRVLSGGQAPVSPAERKRQEFLESLTGHAGRQPDPETTVDVDATEVRTPRLPRSRG